MVLDSGYMTLVHSDLVDPKKVNHCERMHLRCIDEHNSDYPTAEELEQGKIERKEEKSCGVQQTKLEYAKKETPEIAQEFGNMDVDSLIEVPTKAKVSNSRSDKRKERKSYSTLNTELKTEETAEMDPETIRKLQKMDETLESVRIHEA